MIKQQRFFLIFCITASATFLTHTTYTARSNEQGDSILTHTPYIASLNEQGDSILKLKSLINEQEKNQLPRKLLENYLERGMDRIDNYLGLAVVGMLGLPRAFFLEVVNTFINSELEHEAKESKKLQIKRELETKNLENSSCVKKAFNDGKFLIRSLITSPLFYSMQLPAPLWWPLKKILTSVFIGAQPSAQLFESTIDLAESAVCRIPSQLLNGQFELTALSMSKKTAGITVFVFAIALLFSRRMLANENVRKMVASDVLYNPTTREFEEKIKNNLLRNPYQIPWSALKTPFSFLNKKVNGCTNFLLSPFFSLFKKNTEEFTFEKTEKSARPENIRLSSGIGLFYFLQFIKFAILTKLAFYLANPQKQHI